MTHHDARTQTHQNEYAAALADMFPFDGSDNDVALWMRGHFETIRRALEACADGDKVLVPREPTKAMRIAADYNARGAMKLSVRTINEIYRNMVQAAQEQSQ